MANGLYAPIGSASDGSGSYATQDFVREEIGKINISSKQDIISDLETIRSGAAAGATALQAIPDGYVKETDFDRLLADSNTIKTINEQIASISKSIEDATALTNTILNA